MYSPNTASGEMSRTLSQKIVERVGATGLVILLLGTGFSKAAQNIGMGLALLAFLLGLTWSHRDRWWPVIRRDWLFRLTLLWVLYLVGLALIMAQLFPQLAEDHYESAWRLSRLFLVVLVGWWTCISFRSPLTAYWLLLGGIALGLVLFHHELGWPVAGIERRRLDFWENPQFYGLLSGATLLLLGGLAKDFVGPIQQRLFAPRLVLWLALTALSLNAFFLSQARGAMLGLLAALLVLITVSAIRITRKGSVSLVQWLAVVASLVLLAGLLWLSTDQLQNRVSQDLDAIGQAIETPEDIPATSMGIRLYQWQAALPVWLERPVFGWGPGSGSFLHKQVDLPDEYRSSGSHFHNGWLDLLLRTGLVGLVIFLAVLTAWGRALSGPFTAGAGASRTALYSTAILILFAFASLTQAFLTSQVSWFFLGAFLGPALGYHYRSQDTLR